MLRKVYILGIHWKLEAQTWLPYSRKYKVLKKVNLVWWQLPYVAYLHASQNITSPLLNNKQKGVKEECKVLQTKSAFNKIITNDKAYRLHKIILWAIVILWTISQFMSIAF
jgi:hypothetical protein